MFIYVLVSGFFRTNAWKFCFFANKPLEPCFGHIFFVLTPISAILALTRSLRRVQHLSPYSSLLLLFYVLFLILCMFYLCDRVDNALFEGNQEQVYEEENQQFDKEGKWTSPAYSTLSQ